MIICLYRNAWAVLGIMSIGTMLTSCSLLGNLFPQCDKARPAVIERIIPESNSIIMPASPFKLKVVLGFPDGDGLFMDEDLRLFLDGKEITEKLYRGGTDNTPQTGAWIGYEQKTPLTAGKHVAQVSFRSHLRKRYCFEWSFWVTTKKTLLGNN